MAAPLEKLQYTFPWMPGPRQGVETMTLLDGLIKGAVRPDASAAPCAKFRARFEPFELGVFETADQARAAVEERAIRLINAMLATILPAGVKEWLQHT